ncbi:MAG TPA: OmpA family protein, partial [Stellaceae bacterium]|nr:OmpA family protein [Stellaceae bacterium]
FFLLLWLLNATTNAQKRGIADYFAPTLATNSTVSGADGVMGGRTMMEPGSEASNSAPPSLSDALPRVPTNPDSDDDQMYGPGQSQGANDQSGKDESAQGYTVNTQGNYQGAAKGEGAGQGNQGGATDLNGKDARSAGFTKDAKGLDTGKIPLALFKKLMAELEKNPTPQQKAAIEAGLTAEQKALLEKAVAQAQTQALARQQETQQLQRVQEQIENALKTQPELQNLAKNVMVDKVEDGLRIQIIDQQKTAMFNLGSTQLSEAARKLLAEVATSISKLPNQVMITGHTDSTPYLANGDYSNWELSADRANAARRALVGDGFPEAHIATVVGKADTDNLIKDNPADPRNRRISIIVLRADRPAAPKPTVAAAAPPPAKAPAVAVQAQADARPNAVAPATPAQVQATRPPAQAPVKAQATIPAQPAAPAQTPIPTPAAAAAPAPAVTSATTTPATATPATATPAVATAAATPTPANVAIDGIGSAASLPGGIVPGAIPAQGSAAP